MIDEVGQFPPQPTRDIHWDIGIPTELPYTVASLPFRGVVPSSAALAINVPIEEQQTVYVTDWDGDQDQDANKVHYYFIGRFWHFKPKAILLLPEKWSSDHLRASRQFLVRLLLL